MLESFKRLFAGRGDDPGVAEHAELVEWAKRRGFVFKRVRSEAGFVIDGRFRDMPWRLEWGAPQRDYIRGHELRLRMELELPSDAQMLLLSRPLMDALERKTFEDFTDSIQTQVGTKAPEEMRWLVMFPKVNLGEFKSLRGRFGAVASVPQAGLAWLTGPLAHALEQAAASVLHDEPPFVLMTLRGRAYLRLQLATPASNDVAAVLALFETAVAQALLVANQVAGQGREWPQSSGGTAWQTLHADELGRAGKH